MKKYILLLTLILSIGSINAQTTKEKKEGLKIINMVRFNNGIDPLQLDKSLTEYAQKKAYQILNDDLDEVIVSQANVGLLYNVYRNEEEPYSKISRSVLNLIDINCENKYKYDLFNQVVDEISTKVGIAIASDESRSAVVFIFDNYVYNQEVNKEKN